MEEKPTRGGVGGAKRRCRYGAECRNIGKGCKFHHPPSTTATGGASVCNVVKKKPNPKNPEKNAAPKRDRSKIQCRYGMECRNTKCPFFHHPAAVPVSSPDSPSVTDVVNGKTPPKLSPNFSDICHQLIETPSQVSAEQSPYPAYPSGKTDTVTTPSRKGKATTKKKCRWGAGCRNKKCTFFHPEKQFDAIQNPRQKATATAEVGSDPKPKSKVLRSRAAPSDHWSKERASTSRPAVHPILPPSPETQEPLDSIGMGSYPLFPSSQSEVVRAPFQASSTQTTKAFSRFQNIFSPVSNAPASGFLDGGSRERTPLYSKTSSAFRNSHPLNTGETNGSLKKHAPAVHSQDQPPDADWLFEVLGLNDIDTSDTAASSRQRPSVIEDVVEEPYTSASTVRGNIAVSNAKANFSHALPDKQIRPTSKRVKNHVHAANMSNNLVDERPSKKLIPEDEIVESRRAALELRFESQQTAYEDAELLFTLLQTCRSKQAMIKTALERSMDSSAEAGTGAELDETNVVALLELNELLVGAIEMAESSLHIAKEREDSKGDSAKKVNAVKSIPLKRAKGSKTEDDSLWKPVDNKAATAAAAKTAKKKSKPAENPGTSKKAGKKSVKTPKVENQKQEVKPAIAPPQTESPVDDAVSNAAQDAADAAQQEKEKMARLLEEAREQAAAARDRKKSKKNKKFDRWLKQNEEARENRAKSWSERIAKENDYTDLIQKLLVAEFLRQSKNKAMGLTADRVLSDSRTSELIAKECREAYHAIFGGLKCRVVVAGSENKDMNGRQGIIRYWDREKEKYCVGLDTKKTPDSDVQFLIPAILDVLTSSRPPKADKKSSATSYDVDAPDFVSYGGVSLGFNFTLQKSHMIALGSAESTKIGLEVFCESRDEEERRQKIEEEAEKKREEEDRRRRAATRATENTAWEQRKEQMRKDKEEYEEMKKEWAKERREKGGSMFDYEDDDEEECQCPRCRFGDSRFGDRFSSDGGAFFFNIGGIPFRVRFDSYDSDEDSDFDEEFDERWEGQLAEEKEEENRKQAGILGVVPNADGRTIKLAYRKMALQFHPDKWKSDSDHGMTRKEAENQFKSIQSAYDHLMSNFDG
mmetsp:Transcript_20725/g.44979  ORF Transcript_20725/g.44979 Transcript_20725/m.44979 type:complete len:1099 (+) Transcript_20725:245-3541(+)|eukprot:CAMPEP_0172298602 /NCGR_PEP_ID=MMETSP1058-20130122/1181_1 /TAXON_ID=83371 /ORGANISM="Detonula confervacea, Strain CCMP 353" /LENGTH=1098 /DNA_ID=CAMNT_0013007881 /DNA_START=174 /DNA_END=3470 /DNA_ORIENTATION=-